MTRDMILAMCKVTIEERSMFEPVFKSKILIVDDEIYGKVDFPLSMLLGRGKLMSFPGYGQVQVLDATIDTLLCTKKINLELADEFRINPPAFDPVPDKRQPRVLVAPTGLFQSSDDGALSSINRELAESGQQTRDTESVRVSPSEVSCPARLPGY